MPTWSPKARTKEKITTRQENNKSSNSWVKKRPTSKYTCNNHRHIHGFFQMGLKKNAHSTLVYICCNLRDLGGQEKLSQNGSPNGTKKTSKLKHCASKMWFFWDFDGFWQACFFNVFWCWQETGQQIKTNQIFGDKSGRHGSRGIARGGNLYPGWTTKLRFWPFLADSTFLCLTTPDTSRCQRILAAIGFWRCPKIDHFCTYSI